jgi:hypothetical protein
MTMTRDRRVEIAHEPGISDVIDRIEALPNGVAAMSATGLRLHEFEDGAGMVAIEDHALHLTRDQFRQLFSFVRIFDREQAPRTLLTEAARHHLRRSRADARRAVEEPEGDRADIWSALLVR